VLVIGGAVAIDVTVSHGCTALGLPRTVTSAEGGWVHQIDGRPAWDVMKEYLHGDPVDLISADIVHLCIGEPFDPALRQAVGAGFGSEYLIRTPLAQSPDGKSLFFPGGLQLGNQIQFLRRDPELVGATAKQSALTLAERANGRTPLAVLQFDCSGRARSLFGDRTADTLVRPLQQAFGDPPWAGFFTFGEIAQIGSQSCYHNFTVALCALYDA
jgi:small ligand-binding sensory domain FIST